MRSGVDVIYDDLQEALQKGADVKILTGYVWSMIDCISLQPR